MKCVDLCKDTIRITGAQFSYNKTKQDEKNFLLLKSLTLEAKVIVFKFLAISKIVCLSMMIQVQTKRIVELGKLQKRFIWPTNPKIKSKTISSGQVEMN